MCLLTQLGPHHTKASRFNPKAIWEAWTNKRVRLAYIGYLGHMWELYAMWAWIGAIALASYGLAGMEDPQAFATLTAFLAIGAGGPYSGFCFVFRTRCGRSAARTNGEPDDLTNSAGLCSDLYNGANDPRDRQHVRMASGLGPDGHWTGHRDCSNGSSQKALKGLTCASATSSRSG